MAEEAKIQLGSQRGEWVDWYTEFHYDKKGYPGYPFPVGFGYIITGGKAAEDLNWGLVTSMDILDETHGGINRVIGPMDPDSEFSEEIYYLTICARKNGNPKEILYSTVKVVQTNTDGYVEPENVPTIIISEPSKTYPHFKFPEEGGSGEKNLKEIQIDWPEGVEYLFSETGPSSDIAQMGDLRYVRKTPSGDNTTDLMTGLTVELKPVNATEIMHGQKHWGYYTITYKHTTGPNAGKKGKIVMDIVSEAPWYLISVVSGENWYGDKRWFDSASYTLPASGGTAFLDLQFINKMLKAGDIKKITASFDDYGNGFQFTADTGNFQQAFNDSDETTISGFSAPEKMSFNIQKGANNSTTIIKSNLTLTFEYKNSEYFTDEGCQSTFPVKLIQYPVPLVKPIKFDGEDFTGTTIYLDYDDTRKHEYTLSLSGCIYAESIVMSNSEPEKWFTCKLDHQDKKGDGIEEATIWVQANSENNGSKERTCEIRVRTDANTQATNFRFKIIQRRAGGIYANPEMLSFTGGTTTLRSLITTVEPNVRDVASDNWDGETPSWVTATSEDGLVTFNAEPWIPDTGDTEEIRTAQYNVYSSYGGETVTGKPATIFITQYPSGSSIDSLLKVNPNYAQFSYNGGTKRIDVASVGCTISGQTVSNSWYKVTYSGGENNGTLTISAATNTGAERRATYSVYGMLNNSVIAVQNIDIIQNAKGTTPTGDTGTTVVTPALRVSPTNFSFTSGQSSGQATITTTGCSIDRNKTTDTTLDGWATFRYDDNGRLTISATKNETFSTRTVYYTVYADKDDLKSVITVTQKGTEQWIKITPGSYSAPSGETTTATFTVTTNVIDGDFGIQPNATWVRVANSAKTSDDKMIVSFIIDANPSSNSRSTGLTLIKGDYGTTLKNFFTQAGMKVNPGGGESSKSGGATGERIHVWKIKSVTGVTDGELQYGPEIIAWLSDTYPYFTYGTPDWATLNASREYTKGLSKEEYIEAFYRMFYSLPRAYQCTGGLRTPEEYWYEPCEWGFDKYCGVEIPADAIKLDLVVPENTMLPVNGATIIATALTNYVKVTGWTSNSNRVTFINTGTTNASSASDETTAGVVIGPANSGDDGRIQIWVKGIGIDNSEKSDDETLTQYVPSYNPKLQFDGSSMAPIVPASATTRNLYFICEDMDLSTLECSFKNVGGTPIKDFKIDEFDIQNKVVKTSFAANTTETADDLYMTVTITGLGLDNQTYTTNSNILQELINEQGWVKIEPVLEYIPADATSVTFNVTYHAIKDNTLLTGKCDASTSTEDLLFEHGVNGSKTITFPIRKNQDPESGSITIKAEVYGEDNNSTIVTASCECIQGAPEASELSIVYTGDILSGFAGCTTAFLITTDLIDKSSLVVGVDGDAEVQFLDDDKETILLSYPYNNLNVPMVYTIELAGKDIYDNPKTASTTVQQLCQSGSIVVRANERRIPGTEDTAEFTVSWSRLDYEHHPEITLACEGNTSFIPNPITIDSSGGTANVTVGLSVNPGDTDLTTTLLASGVDYNNTTVTGQDSVIQEGSEPSIHIWCNPNQEEITYEYGEYVGLFVVKYQNFVGSIWLNHNENIDGITPRPGGSIETGEISVSGTGVIDVDVRVKHNYGDARPIQITAYCEKSTGEGVTATTDCPDGIIQEESIPYINMEIIEPEDFDYDACLHPTSGSIKYRVDWYGLMPGTSAITATLTGTGASFPPFNRTNYSWNIPDKGMGSKTFTFNYSENPGAGQRTFGVKVSSKDKFGTRITEEDVEITQCAYEFITVCAQTKMFVENVEDNKVLKSSNGEFILQFCTADTSSNNDVLGSIFYPFAGDVQQVIYEPGTTKQTGAAGKYIDESHESVINTPYLIKLLDNTMIYGKITLTNDNIWEYHYNGQSNWYETQVHFNYYGPTFLGSINFNLLHNDMDNTDEDAPVGVHHVHKIEDGKHVWYYKMGTSQSLVYPTADEYSPAAVKPKVKVKTTPFNS